MSNDRLVTGKTNPAASTPSESRARVRRECRTVSTLQLHPSCELSAPHEMQTAFIVIITLNESYYSSGKIRLPITCATIERLLLNTCRVVMSSSVLPCVLLVHGIRRPPIVARLKVRCRRRSSPSAVSAAAKSHIVTLGCRCQPRSRSAGEPPGTKLSNGYLIVCLLPGTKWRKQNSAAMENAFRRTLDIETTNASANIEASPLVNVRC
jgi:hypothetical protein